MKFCEIYIDGYCKWQDLGLEKAPECATEITRTKLAPNDTRLEAIVFKCGAYNAFRSTEEIIAKQATRRERVISLLV